MLFASLNQIKVLMLFASPDMRKQSRLQSNLFTLKNRVKKMSRAAEFQANLS